MLDDSWKLNALVRSSRGEHSEGPDIRAKTRMKGLELPQDHSEKAEVRVKMTELVVQ